MEKKLSESREFGRTKNTEVMPIKRDELNSSGGHGDGSGDGSRNDFYEFANRNRNG